jgi:hypothetical protein
MEAENAMYMYFVMNVLVVKMKEEKRDTDNREKRRNDGGCFKSK